MSRGGMPDRPNASSEHVAVTFRVLGPLEVRVGTTRLEIPGRQERALLALLLTAPGRVFSIPAIVAALWGERPPTGADNTVMSYVSRLRRGMPKALADTVVTRRPGYFLAVEPDLVDAERFRSLAGKGRRELETGLPRLAAVTLREALSLWAGDAYAEFDAPFAVAERRVLEELRLGAVEDRASAELDLGGGADLIAELQFLVSAHPLRERPWAQLMTALYRSGRQGDALLSYQRARSALVEELGVEPGAELQSLHAQVLAHDLRLLGPAAPTRRSPLAASVGPAFFGRARELERLDEAYSQAMGGSIVRVLITGAAGMGKTRVLAELARQVEAAGGSVLDDPAALRAGPEAAPPLVVLDDVQRWAAADLARLSGVLTVPGRPALVVAACDWDQLSPAQTAVIEGLFPDRLPLGPLGPAEVAQLVGLYVPPPELVEALGAAEIVASGGVPLELHAAASRYGERLFTERIGTSAQAISDPRRRLARSRAEVADGVAGLARLRALRQAGAGPDTEPHLCPFKGLAFYDVDDAPYFAGRERLVARLVARLVDAPALAVVGASGSGKSSVVRAGLVAAIGQGLLPGSERWRILMTTPARLPPDLPPAGGPRTLLVVDQLEEMFTILPPEAQAGYAEWLTGAAERDDVTVVAAIRSDYFARLVTYRRLADLAAANTVLVGAMSAEELRQAIEAPAAAAGLQLDPDLARTVADDVVGEPGGLPLMSTALLSLWERGGGRYLSLKDYLETGGVRTAVARLAEAAYAPMTPIQQAHARRILLRLAEVDEAGEPIRRRVALAELSLGGDPDAVRAFESLAAGRLLTVSSTHAEVAHEALLREWPRLRGWLDDDEAGRRLRTHLVPAAGAWQTSARDPAELYRGQRLTAALDFMADHGDDLTDLEMEFLRASRDEAEADVAARRRSHRRLRSLVAGLAVVLLVALGAGWFALDRGNESARLAVEADVRALRAAALGEDRLDLALLYAAQAYQIDHSAQSHAALLRTAHRSPEATALYTTDRRLLGLAVSADGRTLAALGSAGTAYVWNPETGRRTSIVPGFTENEVTSIDLSADGRYLAVVGIPLDADRYDFHQQLMVVDLQAPTHTVHIWEGPGIAAARFTGDGRTMITAGIDGTAREVDVRTGRMKVVSGVHLTISDTLTLDASAGRRYMVAADPDSASLVTAWDTDDGRVLSNTHEDYGTLASINPTGTALVLGHGNGLVEHLDLVTGARRDVPSDPAVGLVDLDWAPDGSAFAGATTEGTVTLWDARSLQVRSVFRGHSGTVSQVTHSADGARLFAAGFDGTVVVWDLTGARGVVRQAAPPTPAARFGPFRAANGVLAANGTVAASYRADGAVVLVDVPASVSSVVPVEVWGSPAQLIADPAGRYAALVTVDWPGGLHGRIEVIEVASRRLLPSVIQVTADFISPAPAFAGDGRSIVTAEDKTVLVSDVQSGSRAAGNARYDASGNVRAVAPDATGRFVAVGVVGGGVEIGDTTTGTLVTSLVPPGGENIAVTPLSFSPDGRWLAGGSESGRIVVWDTATWGVARTWAAVQGGRVDSLAFTPDSRSVVAGGAGTASIWSIYPGSSAGMTFPVSGSPSQADVAVATLDEGRTIVTLTEDNGVQRWVISPQDLLKHACEVAGRNLTRAEWEAALPSLPYAQTCPGR